MVYSSQDDVSLIECVTSENNLLWHHVATGAKTGD